MNESNVLQYQVLVGMFYTAGATENNSRYRYLSITSKENEREHGYITSTNRAWYVANHGSKGLVAR